MGIVQGKTAIITGAGSGIGRAAALLFAREGANVVVADINEQNGRTVVEEIGKAGGKAMFVRADSSKADDNRLLVDTAVKAYGALHIGVNNAGIGGAAGTVADYAIEDWQKVIDINLSGVFYGMKYQIAAMKAAGGGSIVNVASILGNVAFPNAPAYVAAKHGVVGLTKSAAIDHAPDKVRVNAIGPGFIRTPLLESMDADALKYLESLHPLGRLGASEEVAELILWLGSDKAAFVTGAYYPVDGGYLAR